MASAIRSSAEHERRVAVFGSQVRLLVGAPGEQTLPGRELAALLLERLLHRFHDRLSRFEPESELSALNNAQAAEVEVSALLAHAVAAGVWAAERSDGLVDPTLLGALESAGYGASLIGATPASLREALAAAPPRRPAQARPDAARRELSVAGRRVRRPPGVRLDLGGTAKGLAADACAERLAGYLSFAVDAGGDVRLGGDDPGERVIEVEHPLRAAAACRLLLSRGAVATSGLASRIWRNRAGFAHHLIDPSTGDPAWTGVIQASALAPTAVEAEVVAKTALLSGPDAGLGVLERHGGVLILDDGSVLKTGSLREAEEVVAA